MNFSWKGYEIQINNIINVSYKTYFFEISSSANERKDKRKDERKKEEKKEQRDVNLLILTS